MILKRDVKFNLTRPGKPATVTGSLSASASGSARASGSLVG